MDKQSEKQSKSEDLDLEFKKILCAIREQIPYINSNAYLMQCRLWLEKLSNPNVNKNLRNLYLIDLCGQIQKNKLLPPFNEAPPTGSLKSFNKVLLSRKSHKSLLQGVHHKRNRLLCLQNASIHNFKSEYVTDDSTTIPQYLKPDEEICTVLTPKIKHEIHIPTTMEEPIKPENADYQDIDKLKYNSFNSGEPAKHNQNEILNKRSNSKLNEIGYDDDDSWFDLTDVSSGTEFEPHPKDKQLRIPNITHNEGISRNHKKTRSYSLNEMQPGSYGSSQFKDFLIEDSTQNFYERQEFTSKISKDTNYLSEDWKNTIESLQLRLSEMTQQNNELNAVIQKMETQIEDIKNKNMEERDQTLKMLENLHSLEIAKLKEIHSANIIELEKSFEAKKEKLESDHQEKLKEVIHTFEKKITELNMQMTDVSTKKDYEIGRLTEIIQQQCERITLEISTLQTQISDCSCDRKLRLLQKCVSKMDRLFQKSEKEYLRQIKKLRQELELKNNALQIQLKMQKAELISETSSERQEEFDKILNSLEVKYIKMLEMYEHQIMEMKRQDDEQIQTLKGLLTEHGISYDVPDLSNNDVISDTVDNEDNCLLVNKGYIN